MGVMNLLAGYGSDEEEATPAGLHVPATSTQRLQAQVCQPMTSSAPAVSVVPYQHSNVLALTVAGGNATLDSLQHGPSLGPVNPFRTHGALPGVRVAGMGTVSTSSLSDYTFHEQFNSFERDGFAIDSSTNEVLGDYNAYLAAQQRGSRGGGGGTDSSSSATASKRKRSKIEVAAADLGDDAQGPWAPLPDKEASVHAEMARIASAAAAAASEKTQNLKSKEEEKEEAERVRQEADKAKGNVHINEPDEEAEMWEKHSERKIGYMLPPRPQKGAHVQEATSTFHGTSLVDYQGRSWMTPPAGVRSDGGDHEAYIPKKCVKKFTGHTKGVQAIEFFPGTGHLLLSASMDGKCKLWDVYGDRNVRRTFSGHTEAVRSIHMSNDGKQFLSSGYDRMIRQWDLETGQALGTFSNLKVCSHPLRRNFFHNFSYLILFSLAFSHAFFRWATKSSSTRVTTTSSSWPPRTTASTNGTRARGRCRRSTTTTSSRATPSPSSTAATSSSAAPTTRSCSCGSSTCPCPSSTSRSPTCSAYRPSRCIPRARTSPGRAWTTRSSCTSAVTR